MNMFNHFRTNNKTLASPSNKSKSKNNSVAPNESNKSKSKSKSNTTRELDKITKELVQNMFREDKHPLINNSKKNEQNQERVW